MDRNALKQAFIEARGYWSPLWDETLRLDPAFFAAYLTFSAIPWRHGVLPPVVKELIYVAIDVSTTHLYDPGTRIHMANALGLGATPAQVMEVMELAATLGVDTVTTGLPILLEELAAAGRADELPARTPGPDQARIKADFTARHAGWTEAWEAVLTRSPAYFEAFADLAAVPWNHGTLEPKTRALVCVALHASVTHLDVSP